MKSTIIPFVFLLTSLLTMNLHCEKDKDEEPPPPSGLPPITTSGANTFGCTINGKNWVAYTNYSFPKLRVNYNKSTGSLQIIADKKIKDQNEDEEFQIIGYAIKEAKKYFLGHHLDKINTSGQCMYAPPDFGYLYYTDSTHLGELNVIKIDTINRILSGTFHGNLFMHDAIISKDTIVNVRNGRFDVKY